MIWLETLNEIAQRPNPERRLRTYPRVVKRHRHGEKPIKRHHHTQARYTKLPKIKIRSQLTA